MVLRCCLNNMDALRTQAIIVDTIAVIIPPAISNGKCCAKYMREYATQQASINKNNFNHLYFVIVTSKNIIANAVVVCPDGKLPISCSLTFCTVWISVIFWIANVGLGSTGSIMYLKNCVMMVEKAKLKTAVKK